MRNIITGISGALLLSLILSLDGCEPEPVTLDKIPTCQLCEFKS